MQDLDKKYKPLLLALLKLEVETHQDLGYDGVQQFGVEIKSDNVGGVEHYLVVDLKIVTDYRISGDNITEEKLSEFISADYIVEDINSSLDFTKEDINIKS